MFPVLLTPDELHALLDVAVDQIDPDPDDADAWWTPAQRAEVIAFQSGKAKLLAAAS